MGCKDQSLRAIDQGAAHEAALAHWRGNPTVARADAADAKAVGRDALALMQDIATGSTRKLVRHFARRVPHQDLVLRALYDCERTLPYAIYWGNNPLRERFDALRPFDGRPVVWQIALPSAVPQSERFLACFAKDAIEQPAPTGLCVEYRRFEGARPLLTLDQFEGSR